MISQCSWPSNVLICWLTDWNFLLLIEIIWLHIFVNITLCYTYCLYRDYNLQQSKYIIFPHVWKTSFIPWQGQVQWEEGEESGATTPDPNTRHPPPGQSQTLPYWVCYFRKMIIFIKIKNYYNIPPICICIFANILQIKMLSFLKVFWSEKTHSTMRLTSSHNFQRIFAYVLQPHIHTFIE